MRIQNIDTLADLIDRLAVTVHLLAYFENEKRELQGGRDLLSYDTLIAEMDNKSRDCCELRSAIKQRIDEVFRAVVNSGEYKTLSQPRSFRPAGQRASDLIEAVCNRRADQSLNGELAQALEDELCES